MGPVSSATAVRGSTVSGDSTPRWVLCHSGRERERERGSERERERETERQRDRDEGGGGRWRRGSINIKETEKETGKLFVIK